MKNWIKIFLIVEIQCILLFLIAAIIKINKLDHKVYNTNKFVYEALMDKRILALNEIKDNDIVVGNPNAPVTVFLYSRFDCSACNDFFNNNYERLKTDYINDGKVKLVVRYLVHPSKPVALYAAKCAFYMSKLGYFDLFTKRLRDQYPISDTALVKGIVLNLARNSADFNVFVSDKTMEELILQFAATIRHAGIRSTPTLFINNQQIVGNPNYERLKKLILSALENESWEN